MTAATNVQDAIDVSVEGDTVRVDAGTYYPGAEIRIEKSITLESMRGAGITVLDGQGEHRLLYIFGSTVDGFTIRNGFADNGGGIRCFERSLVKNCIVSFNTTEGSGGGIVCDTDDENITVRNCIIVDNLAERGGGLAGFGEATVENCVIAENTATSFAGGLYFIFGSFNVRNCIIWNNTAPEYDNWRGSSSIFLNVCTIPTVGENCVTNDPMLDAEGRLLAGSPCIDAGMEIAGLTSDIEGTPRPLDGDADGIAQSDIGAYEFVNPLADSDGDSVIDPSEIVAGTDPTNSNDWFHITAQDGSTIWFPSVLDRLYTLEASTNLVLGGWYGITNQVGSGAEIQLTDPNTNAAAFYRVRVELF
ncbi:right-handed parallel beta-helix repeat-containing protein [Pontiellaceae bacterium B1224]|nr:right-handed parallel beta-helix repeat-containing protein [Pontiellaceae bacterium B1224]